MLGPVEACESVYRRLLSIERGLIDMLAHGERLKAATPVPKHGGGGDGGQLPYLGEMPPWALDNNPANNPFLTNGFQQPTKPEGGG